LLNQIDYQLLSSDPVVFISYYSGHKLQDFQCQILYAVDDNKHDRSIVLLPAGHGKSELIAKWYTIFKIAQNRNIRIILIMKNDEEVKQYARAIRSELSNNRKLTEDFGRFQPKARDSIWSNDAIEVCGRQISAPAPTVLFASSNTIEQTLGKRCDLFIADDIVTPGSVSTQAQRDKQWSIFNEGVETGPQYLWDFDQNGHLYVPEGINWPSQVTYRKGIIAGTVFHPDDLFHRKVEGKGIKIADMENGKLYAKCKDPKYVAIKFDCWKDTAKTTPLWDSRWSAKELEEKEKSIGTIEFNRRYRNIAIDEGMTVFRKPWIYGGNDGIVDYPGCLDRYRSFGETDFLRADGKKLEKPYIVLGLDPSTGRRGKGTTFSSFIIMLVDRAEVPMRRYVIDVFRKQMGFDDIISYLTTGDQARGIEGFFTKYHYHEGRVEANAAQTYLLENQRVKSAGLMGCRLLPHETQARNKNDSEIGVQSMQSMFKDGLVRIPYQNPSDIELAQEFIDQLLIFPLGVYDYAMAIWFAELAIRGLGSKYRATGPERGFRIVNRSFVR